MTTSPTGQASLYLKFELSWREREELKKRSVLFGLGQKMGDYCHAGGAWLGQILVDAGMALPLSGLAAFLIYYIFSFLTRESVNNLPGGKLITPNNY